MPYLVLPSFAYTCTRFDHVYLLIIMVHCYSHTLIPCTVVLQLLCDGSSLYNMAFLRHRDVLQYIEDGKSGRLRETTPTSMTMEETAAARPAPERGGGEGDEVRDM